MKKRLVHVLMLVAVAAMLLVGAVPRTAFSESMGQGAIKTHNAMTLVLDESGSMDGDKIAKLKEATKKVVETVLNKEPEAKISIVGFGTYTHVLPFTSEKKDLDDFVDKMSDGGGTDVTAALKEADEVNKLLQDTDFDSYARSIVIMSDGMPDSSTSAKNQYDAMQDHYSVYSVGFFTGSGNHDSERNFLKSIQNKGYFEANELDDLIKRFVELTDQILNPLVVTVDSELVVPTINRYRITALVSNPNEAGTVDNVKATIKLDNILSLYNSNESQDLGDIAAGDKKTVTWEVEAPLSSSASSSIYSVTAKGDNTVAITQEGRIYLKNQSGKDNKIIFGQDNWNIKNNNEWHLMPTDEQALLMTSAFYRTGGKEPFDAMRAFIQDIDNEGHVGGNCDGFASSLILTKMDVDNPLDRSNPTSSNLFGVRKNDSVMSYVNYYWVAQNTNARLNARDDFMAKPIKDQLKEIELKVSLVPRGGSPVLLPFGYYYTKNGERQWGGHTVVADSLSKVTDVDVQEEPKAKGMTEKIRIIDSNFPNDSDRYLYLNPDEGAWVYKAELSATYVGSSDNEGYLQAAINDLGIIGLTDNGVATKNATLRASANARTNMARFSSGKSFSWTSFSDVIKGGTGWTVYSENTDASSPAALNIVLPDKTQPYTVSTPDSYGYSLYYGDIFEATDADAADSTTFSPNGDVSLSGNKGKYQLTAAADGLKSPWYTYKVTGSDAKDVKLVKQSDGYIIEGDDLGDAKVSANNVTDTKSISLHTDAKRVKVGADESGKNLIASIDKDGNGTFETVIADSSKPTTPPTDPGHGGTTTPSRPSDPAHNVAVSTFGNGKATASPSSAKPGDKVTVTVAPDEGYRLAELSAADASGKPVRLTYANGAYTFEMPATDATVTARFVEAGPESFPDVVAGSWYAPGVDFVSSRGIMEGYGGSDLFGVGRALTRAEFAQLLYNRAQHGVSWPDPKNRTGMADVKDDEWYTAAANWAVESHVIEGYANPDGSHSFGPSDPVTLEQMTTILARLTGADVSKADLAELNKYVDPQDVSPWAKRYVAWGSASGVFSGSDEPDGRHIRPAEPIMRERVATVIKNAYDKGVLE